MAFIGTTVKICGFDDDLRFKLLTSVEEFHYSIFCLYKEPPPYHRTRLPWPNTPYGVFDCWPARRI